MTPLAPGSRVLVCRTDSDGDVLLAGPAVAAVAAAGHEVHVLTSSQGAAAARLLPGVASVLVTHAPWSGYRAAGVEPGHLSALVHEVRDLAVDAAVVLCSFHQSPLPLALLLKTAGVPFVAAPSTDYPGSLLDLRLPGVADDDPRHEVERGVDTVVAAGVAVRPARPRLAVVAEPAPTSLPRGPFVVVHPGASVPARAPRPDDAAAHVRALVDVGRTVVVTGAPGERELTAAVAADLALDLGGRTTLGGLAAVLAAADAVVVGNTGPAHLAAAVGTPVVSLFSPVVPQRWWAPWGVPVVLLGDQSAGCAGTRARECPVAGHPCLSTIAPADVVAAVDRLAPPTGARADTPLEVA